MWVTQETVQALVLEDTDGRWELYHGQLREKPSMSVGHNESAWELADQLSHQLSSREYRVFQNRGNFRAPNGSSFVPDVAIVPVEMIQRLRQTPRQFEIYDDPVLFVAEFWSPRTGTYDIDTKFPAYKLRGDAEIWRVHPFDCVVTIWRRQPDDGEYSEEIVTGGRVQLHALPSVTVEIEALFVGD
jgi:Uma2 family endonuclease